MTCRKSGERPRVVVVDGLQLVEHRAPPAILSLGFCERCWFFSDNEMQHLIVRRLLQELRALRQLGYTSRGAEEVGDEAEAVRRECAVVGVEEV
jgi:hypothetical protein